MILDRLKEFIDSKGITIAAFERSIGMSNASFGKSLKNKGAIGSDKLEIILRVYPEISPTWLLTGEGEMLKESCDISGNVVGNISAKHSGSVRVSQSTCDQSETIEALRAHLAEKERTIQIQQQLIEALKK